MELLIRRHTGKLLSLMGFALLFSSCEKSLDKPKDEGHPILYGYYQESKGLNKNVVDIDSVCRFSETEGSPEVHTKLRNLLNNL